MKTRLSLPIMLMACLIGTGTVARAATQYWDTDGSAGIQGGNGAWSASDADWSSTRAGSALSGWTGGNDAWFVPPSNGLPSVVTLTNNIGVNSVIITGSVYSIVVTNGGQLLAGGTDSVIGASASNNTVSVIGGANGVSIWELGTGASKKMLTLGTGNNAGFTNNALIIDGAGVPGSAVVTNMAQFRMGENVANFPAGGNHRLVISRGGRLYSVGGAIGYDRYSSRNTATLTDPGTLWDLGGGDLKVGSPIANGSDAFNTMTIADQAVVTNAGSVKVHYGISSGNDINTYNQLIVTNGGKLYSGAAAGYLGDGSSNSIVVAGGTGVTSLWSSAAAFTLGLKGNNNLLLVDGLGSTGSAVVTGMNGMTLGSTAYALGNTLQVRGGGMLSFSNTLTSGGTNGLVLFESGAQVVFSGPGVGIQLNKGNVDISGAGTLVDFGGKTFSCGFETNQWVAIRDGAVVVNCPITLDGNSSAYGKCPRLDVTGGGQLTSTYQNPMYIPQYPSCATVTVSGAGSVFNAGGSPISVGSYRATSSNTLLIANGGIVTNASSILLANDSATTTFRNNWGNSVVITNGGKLFTFAAASYVGYSSGFHNNGIVVRDPGSAWSTLGGLTIGFNTTCTGNFVTVDNGGSITNVAAITFSGVSGRLIVTNAGSFLSTGAVAINGLNNEARITGSNSTWALSGAALALAVSGTNNAMVIDQGGAVNNVGSLTVAAGNSVQLLGGTLAATNTAVANGQLFTAGDGVQTATLKGLGGTLAFASGLQVNTNATLTGAGSVSGAGTGVSLLNGGTLNPGAGGAGSITISGSNLTWNTGGLYRCEITDMNGGPGYGWDLLTVASQLVMNGAGLVIKIDSMGAPAANFDSGKDYNLRILGYGTQTGYNPANITVDTNAFVGGGVWTVTNAVNALWLTYRGAAAPAAANYTWNAPNTGPWSEAGNWAGASIPPTGGGASLALAFGDTGVKYTSTNNLAGNFLLNQLRLSSASVVTNVLAGNQIALTNTGARLDYIAGETGSYLVSNAVRLTTDTEVGGNALASTLRIAGTVTNLGTLTKRGTWTLALANTGNNFAGPVVVDSPDGILRLDAASTLNGAGNVTVSNGMLLAYGSHTFSPGYHNRRGLVTGSASVWTNPTANNVFSIGSGATNVQFVVDAGRLICVSFNPFKQCRDSLLVVTNGGYILSGANAYSVADTSTNCQMFVTGTNSAIYFNQNFGVSSGGRSNLLVVEKGATIKGGNNFFLYAGSTLNGYIIRDGGIALPYGLSVLGSNNTALITGAGTLVTSQGGSYLSTVGAGTDFGNTMTIADQAVINLFNLNMAMAGSYSNTLVITNAGKAYANSGFDTFVASGLSNAFANKAIVTGPGSQWNLGNRTLTVCSGTGMLNQVIVENGGLVTNVATLTLASGPAASNNNVTVNGGLLAATTLNFGNPLPNGFTLTGGGQVTLVNLVLTNAAHTFAFNGGTLNLRNTLATGGLPFLAGDGAQTAVLNLLPGVATNLFADGLVITNNATLSGAGLLQATGTIFGTLSPGAGVGIFTNNGAISLQPGSATRIELAAYTAPGAGWDCLAVTNGALQLGGSLNVLLAGGFMPTNTQSFLIMTNMGPAGVSNTFANLQSGTIPASTNWGGKAVGLFQVKVGPQGVVLDSFTLLRANPGSLIMIR